MECVISFFIETARACSVSVNDKNIYYTHNKLKRDIINNDATVTLGLSRRDDCVNDFFFPQSFRAERMKR